MANDFGEVRPPTQKIDGGMHDLHAVEKDSDVFGIRVRIASGEAALNGML